MYIRALIAALLLPVSLSAQSNLIQNGSFESNGGANSNVLPGWSLVDEAGGNGTWLAQTGTTGPVTSTCGPDDVAAPPDGLFAAMTSQAAEGSHVLYQDVFIPIGTAPVLSFQYFIRSAAGLVSPDSLSIQARPNQQFRVDIIDPASNPFTLNVLQNVLVVGGGNPRQFGYETHTVTLSGLGGRTVRLRFAEADTQGCFYAGVDNVRLQTGAATIPATIVRFTATPTTVPFAGAATLTWVTENATSVEIDNGVGPVALSGSRSVSLQREATYTLTATGPSGTARRTVSISVRSPGPVISFGTNPSFIAKGNTSTLSWNTTGATDVSIDNGIGAVATAGSLTVTPTSTTEYTLTATGSGVTSTARATVFVDPGDVPIISVTSFPAGIVGVAGAAAGLTDRLALTNLGRVGTTITLAQSGDFFTQSPATFDLAPGATQVVTVTTTAQAAGKYEGTSLPSGQGVPQGLTIRVRLFLATPPTGSVTPTTAVARTEIAAPANENPSGSVSFTNRGTGTLQGIVTSDVPWLIPQTDAVVIGPGATRDVTFTTNRALRPDAASPGGAAVGTLTLSYLDFGGSSSVPRIAQAGSTPGRASISVTVIDVVKSTATPAGPQPLASGEVAFFVPGLAQVPGSSGDLLLSVTGNSIADLKLFLGAPGSAPVLGALDQIAPNAGIALPSILQSVFASNAVMGTVQARSMSIARVSLSGLQTNTTSPAGTFVTAVPTFRSDLSAAPDGTVYLPGVEKTPERFTNLFVQEVTGLAAQATIEYLDATGNVLNSRTNEIAAFALLSLPDSAPAGAASVRVTNSSRTAARIVAYAALVDAATKDVWTITNVQSTAPASAEQVVAIVPPPASAAISSNAFYIINPDASAIEVTFEDSFTPGRRRAVRTDDASATATAITIRPRETVRVPVAFTNGLVRVTSSRPFVMTARSMQVSASSGGSFGTALPVSTPSTALTVGQSRRFASVDDTARSTVASAAPGTYRSNLGLIGSPTEASVVRLTLRYSFSGGIKTTAQGISSVDIHVPANRLLMINEISRAVIGPSRDALSDLRNMQLDVSVVSGGRVYPFVQMIDNGSGDSTIRTQ